jgi:hypothetical protein
MKRAIATLLLTGLAAVPQVSRADDAITWGNVKGWLIAVDQSMGMGCYISAAFEAGTIIRVGFTEERSVYVAVGDVDWKSIEAGKEYELSIRMDNEEAWTGTSTARQVGDGLVMLGLTTTNTNFLAEFMTKHGVKFIYRGKTIASLSLRGSYATIAEMIRCQAEVNDMIADRDSGDPFRESKPQPASDPFASSL